MLGDGGGHSDVCHLKKKKEKCVEEAGLVTTKYVKRALSSS